MDETMQWKKLPPRVRSVWMTVAGLESFALICVAVGCVVWSAMNGWGIWQIVAAAAAVALAGVALIAGRLRCRYAYAFTRYSIGPDDICVRHGWLWKTTEIVPYNRVQHVDIEQGPVLRLFHLSSISISVAAGQQRIEGIDPREAQEVTRRILEHVRTAKEDL